jgi:hypothetical protein
MKSAPGVTYKYDGAGRRTVTTTAAETTYYFYGQTGLMSEFSTSNTIADATQAQSTDRIEYAVAEHNGTPVVAMRADGTPLENNRTFPNGEPFDPTVSAEFGESFTSYHRDDDTHFDYAMARMYASNEGRFMTPDPGHVGANICDPQSWNAYA